MIFGLSGVESPRSETVVTTITSFAAFITFAGTTVGLDLDTAVGVSARTFVRRSGITGCRCGFVRSFETLWIGSGHGDDNSQKNELKMKQKIRVEEMRHKDRAGGIVGYTRHNLNKGNTTYYFKRRHDGCCSC